MNKQLRTFKYIFFDSLSAIIAWSIFIYFRSEKIENVEFSANSTFFMNLSLELIFWLILYFFTGFYKDIYKKSRLNELVKVLGCSLIGVTILFFGALLDDVVINYTQYYTLYIVLFSLHFSITAFFRLLFANQTAKLIHQKIIGFNTIIIGNESKALKLIEELKNEKKSSGHKIIGYLDLDGVNNKQLNDISRNLGNYQSVLEVIKKYNIEDVIIALDKNEHSKIEQILHKLEQTNVFIKVIPEMYDILIGRVKLDSILGTPLIKLNNDSQPEWEKRVKLLFDYFFAFLCVVIFFPVFIICAIIIKFESPGPIIYKQKRIGINGKIFTILKFRSMYLGSEKDGPKLSSKSDNRVTKFGRFMRKVRLDETLQFFNILNGDMSFVGPRPERPFYADKLTKMTPHYSKLYKVKPGITSLGMVKYGYAENIDQMLERLKYDLIYIKNKSLLIDLKILIHTIVIIVERKGK